MTGAPASLAEYRDYAVFGLSVRSNVELPDLFPAVADAPIDVTIEVGSVPFVGSCEHDGLNQVDGALILVVPEVARYRIEGGNRITVEPEPGVPERNVRLFLLGSALGALLHQRGLLPLHANAVEIDGRAVAFMGKSGAGKSTLAAWFHDRGYLTVADDVCVIGVGDGGPPHVEPGMPRLRLWEEALEATGRTSQNYPRSYAGDDSWNKFDVPIEASAVADRRLPLRALYALERGEAFDLRRSEGLEAVEAVFAHTYRGSFVAAAKGTQRHWETCVQLARTVPVFRMVRPWNLGQLDLHNGRVLDHARQLP